MLEAVPLLAVTLVFLSFFTYVFVSVELDVIRKQWDERRCEPMVMMVAQLVPDPKDKTIDRNKFASDNFDFCIQKLVDASMATAATPVLKVFQQQVDATKPIQTAMNNLRGSTTDLITPLTQIFGSVFDRFKTLGYGLGRIFYKLFSSLNRVFGVATASLFAGMSMYKSIQNSMEFVINVCITILTVLSVLVIFLWFVMWPVIPVILTLIGVLSATVHSGNVSGLRGSFCVAPDTRIVMRDGTCKRADALQPGDLLTDGEEVEGVLTTENNTACVCVKGVVLAPSHLVLAEDGKWIFAKDYPGARIIVAREAPRTLICLNTTHHTWRTESGLVLRDWEELPDGNDAAWEKMIEGLLNKSYSPRHSSETRVPGRGLCGEATVVWEAKTGPVVLRDIGLGDMVKDRRSQFTRVIGIYRDKQQVGRSGLTAEGWIWSTDTGRWVHPMDAEAQKPLEVGQGIHLITDSGTFLLYGNQWVRDFTEVGHTHIHFTYPFTQSLLNFTETK